MKVNYPEIRKVLKFNKTSLGDLCNKLEITRATFRNWEVGKTFPSELKIRGIAKFLKVNVSSISTLQGIEESDVDLSESIDAWITLCGKSETDLIREQSKLISLFRKQQTELRQALVLINAFSASFQSAFYIKDKNQKYIIANNAFLKLTSHKANINIHGLNDNSFFTQNDAKVNMLQDSQVLSTGKPVENIEGYLPGSRKRLWGLTYKYPILDIKERIVGVVGVFIDITEKRKKENILEILKESIDKRTSVTLLINLKGEIEYLSHNLEKEFGYKNSTIDKNYHVWIENVIHPLFRETEGKYFNYKNWPSEYKSKIVTADGKEKYVEASVLYLNEYYLIIYKDITNKFRDSLNLYLLESVLPKSKVAAYAFNKKKWILNDSSEIPFITNHPNTKYNILFLNNGIEEITGYPVSNFYKYPDFFFTIIHPQDVGVEKKYFLNASWPEKRTYRIIRKDGQVRKIRSTIYKGKEDYDFLIDFDITDLCSED